MMQSSNQALDLGRKRLFAHVWQQPHPETCQVSDYSTTHLTMFRPAQFHSAAAPFRAARLLHSSSVVAYPRKTTPKPMVTKQPSEAAIAEGLEAEEGTDIGINSAWDVENLEEFKEDDTTAAGHIWLQQQRQTLQYLRLIEHEMPQLVGEFYS